ncbi:ribonucleases P/MRP protein subunit POP1-domain-containing protein [Xylariaceae sp. AK1471]|nr:ribonucleases P/MRP protein subunit POP1-domain-containing protein [Xylariaceae sp. AK1471]
MPSKQASQSNPSRPPSASSGQSNKRKQASQGSNSSQQNPRAAKRTKLYESRSIAVQSPHAALQNGELNVQSFVNSMAFEINALDESMRRSRTSGASRAFQRVPFTMRRRTAAHNYKRIPKRLHRRAQREMAEDNTPTVNSRTRKPKTSKSRLRAETAQRLDILAKRKQLLKMKKGLGSDTDAIATRAARPKIRRNEPNDLPVTAPRYRKRQLNKTWLPTHMWHAKRARMTPPSEPLWGFSIPLTPTQKNYRPTHRVQWEKGAMAWDMSYMSTIGLFGKENIIQNIFKDMGLAQESLWNDKGKRWRAGAVHWTGNLSRKFKNAVHFIGPATIIWSPQKALEASEADTPPRQLFIRIHPSIFFETFNELLQLIKGYKPRPYIQDLRHEIGSIDVTGPDSTEALLGVLKPSKSDLKEAHASKFESLLGLRDPASLPLGALLAFSVIDPRLKYPPGNVQPPAATNQQVQMRLMESISAFRKEEALELFQLFDRDVRFKASKLPSQKSLNRRRGKTAPGTTLEPSSNIDPPIPIMLLASRNANETRIPGSWTVLLPWKCVQSVWYSLMHYPLSTGGNPAFGGLDEIRQLTFERSQPWFPGDVLGTDAGNAWEMRERQVRQKAWERKPKGKRVKWESLDLGAGRKGEVGVGWSCDFESLFNLRNPNIAKAENLAADNNREDDDHEISEVAKATSKKRMPNKPEPLMGIKYLPKTVFNSFLSSPAPGPLPVNSVVTVSISILGRGVVTTCARVYRLPDSSPASAAVVVSSQAEVPATEPPRNKSDDKLPTDLRDQWLSQRPTKSNPSKNKKTPTITATPEARRQALAQHLVGPVQSYPPLHPNSSSINGHPLCPDAEDLIGFVTTGSYNLRNGHGEAIAGLSAQYAMKEMKRYKNPKDPAARLCVVRDTGQGVGWLARWELI